MTLREDSGQTHLIKITDKKVLENARIAFAKGHRLGPQILLSGEKKRTD